MGLMDELKRLARPYEDEDEFEEEEPKTIPIDQERKSYDRPSDAEYTSVSARPSRPARAGTNDEKVISIHATTQLKVVVVRPEKFDDVNEIASQLMDGRAVVMNLESTDKGEARRLVDFLSGAAYVLDGKIKKVAVSTYIITPCNVDIIGDRTLLTELESSGVYSFQ